MTQKKRLSKVLAASGIASRRACEALIFNKKVCLNGKIVLLPQTLVNPQKDEITVENKPLPQEEKKVYYILNKPKGYICSNKREKNKRLVIDLFSKEKKRLFTVGRLDRDTTGLLIVTNDGHFANQIIHPSNNITKEYILKTTEDISYASLIKIKKGTKIQGHWISPYKIKKLRCNVVKIAVKEGKKREVRLLAQHAGLTPISLKRIRIGALQLEGVKLGQYREMKPNERALFL